MKILNLGCGHVVVKDWVNVDIDSNFPNVHKMDFLNGLDFPDNTFDSVYMSHVLEHIPLSYISRVMCEVKRVLKKDGVLRIVVPDLEEMARSYLGEIDAERISGERSWKREWLTLEFFDQMVRTKSRGLMGNWLDEIATVDEEANRYVKERVGEAVRFDGSKSSTSKKSLVSLAVDLEVDSKLRVIFGRPSLPKGERHFWVWDEFSLRDLSQVFEFSVFMRMSHKESTLGDLFRIVDVDDSGHARKGKSSIYVELIK